MPSNAWSGTITVIKSNKVARLTDAEVLVLHWVFYLLKHDGSDAHVEFFNPDNYKVVEDVASNQGLNIGAALDKLKNAVELTDLAQNLKEQEQLDLLSCTWYFLLNIHRNSDDIRKCKKDINNGSFRALCNFNTLSAPSRDVMNTIAGDQEEDYKSRYPELDSNADIPKYRGFSYNSLKLLAWKLSAELTTVLVYSDQKCEVIRNFVHCKPQITGSFAAIVNVAGTADATDEAYKKNKVDGIYLLFSDGIVRESFGANTSQDSSHPVMIPTTKTAEKVLKKVCNIALFSVTFSPGKKVILFLLR